MPSNEILQVISEISGILEAVAVIASLVYLARQVRDSTKATKGATYQAIVDSIGNLEERISSDAEVTRIFRTGQKSLETLNSDERLRFSLLMFSFFNLYENLFYQYRNNLVEEELWASWCRDMRTLLSRPGVVKWWDNYGSKELTRSFCEYVASGQCPRR